MSRLLGLDFAVLRAEAAQKVPYAKRRRESVEDEWISGDIAPETAVLSMSGGVER